MLGRAATCTYSRKGVISRTLLLFLWGRGTERRIFTEQVNPGKPEVGGFFGLRRYGLSLRVKVSLRLFFFLSPRYYSGQYKISERVDITSENQVTKSFITKREAGGSCLEARLGAAGLFKTASSHGPWKPGVMMLEQTVNLQGLHRQLLSPVGNWMLPNRRQLSCLGQRKR